MRPGKSFPRTTGRWGERFLLLFFLVGVVAATPVPVGGQQGRNGMIKGDVINQTGTPVAGATVELAGSGG